MLHQRIVLPKTGVNIVTYLTHNDALEGKYIAGPVDEFNRQRPMVLVFPGGGYERLSPRENEPVALRLVALGIQTVVVEYSCFPALYPTALEQAAEAALSEDWETAEALAEQTGVRWVQHRKRAAAFADHEPMEEIDALFAQLEVYRSAQDAVSFAAVCKLLSCQLQALGDAHIPTWWNLL